MHDEANLQRGESEVMHDVADRRHEVPENDGEIVEAAACVVEDDQIEGDLCRAVLRVRHHR